jgi:uncharacterized membrane protein SpoIIM required for sporulation
MFSKEEREEEREKRAEFTRLDSLKHFFQNNQAIRVYASIFLGIYLAYMLFSFILPQLGLNTFDIFKEQLFIDPALRGRAFDTSTFFSILGNNWWVLLACFLLAIIVGDGAIFFITWNASSWGALFGYRSLSAGLYAHVNPWWYLFLVFIITLPHVILEGGAYILSAISGSIVSDEIVKEKGDIRKFVFFIIIGGSLLFALGYAFSSALGEGAKQFLSISSIILISAMIYMLGQLFTKKSLKKVFMNNYDLFILAIIVFIIGAIVETLVLNHSEALNTIYSFSMLFS